MDYTQFKGKPFQVVSKLGVRYTGIFDHISQEDQTICLSQVFNHGTEDRPSVKKFPGSTSTLGWVRFHTESIDSLALVENYVPPGEEQPVDPILASVSQNAPGAQNAQSTTSVPHPPAASAPPVAPPVLAAPPISSAPAPVQPVPSSSTLPQKPQSSSISTTLDRVQQSLADLSVNNNHHTQNNGGYSGRGQRRGGPRHNQQRHAIEVPDAEFDFSKGTQKLEAEREARKVNDETSTTHEDEDDTIDDGPKPHPLAIKTNGSSSNGTGLTQANLEGGGGSGVVGSPEKKPGKSYNKDSFFDELSGENSRVSKAEERGRNYDTFGEAGNNYNGGMRGGYRGGGGGGGGGGGYRGGRGRGGGYGQSSNYGQQGGGGYGQSGNNYGGYGQSRGGRGYPSGGGGGYRGRGGGYRQNSDQ